MSEEKGGLASWQLFLYITRSSIYLYIICIYLFAKKLYLILHTLEEKGSFYGNYTILRYILTLFK